MNAKGRGEPFRTRDATTGENLRRDFSGTPEQVQGARRWVDGLLNGCPVAADVVLLLDEVAANAVQHTASGRGGGGFRVEVHLADNGVHVRVLDQGASTEPRILDPGEDWEDGRGLRLVAALSDHWGVSGDPDGRAVWFDFTWKPLS